MTPALSPRAVVRASSPMYECPRCHARLSFETPIRAHLDACTPTRQPVSAAVAEFAALLERARRKASPCP